MFVKRKETLMNVTEILTKNNIADLKKGNIVSISFAISDELSADIRVVKKNNSYQVIVRLICNNPKSDTGLRQQKTVNDIEIVDATILTLIRSLSSSYEYKKKGSRKRSHNKGTISNFKERVLSVEGINSPESYGIRKHKKYFKEETISNSITFLVNTIGGIINDAGHFDLLEEEWLLYFNRDVNRIVAAAKKKGEIVFRDKIAASLANRWTSADEVAELCREKAPDNGPWPSKIPDMTGYGRSSAPELIKVLPYRRYITVVTFLVLACCAGIPEAFAGCGLVLCGMRVGESAALVLGKFIINGNIGKYYICQQVNNKGTLTDQLKNDYSYRYAFVYGIMLDIFYLRRKQLQEYGYSEDEIARSLLGSDNNNPHQPIRKDKVSAFLKDLLVLAGCTRNEIKTIEADIRGDKGNDCEHDFCAHLFRRNIASMAANGGMDMQAVDALLGHENPANKNKDYAAWDNVEKMVKLLNRCIYFGSLTVPINAAYCDTPLENMNYILDGKMQYSFTMDYDGYISGSIETMESDDEITIKHNMETPVVFQIASKTDNKVAKEKRMVLSHIPSNEEIERWIEEAKSLWDKYINGEVDLSENDNEGLEENFENEI